MKIRCEDLYSAGGELIPRGHPLFAPFSEEIRRHVESPPPGSRPPLPHRAPPDWDAWEAAILWNRSDKPICAWTLVWTYGVPEEYPEAEQCRIVRHTHTSGVGSKPSLIVPFGLPEEKRAFATYWYTILPGSKRFVSDGCVAGSNTDVRPPTTDEYWLGGVFGFGGGKQSPPEKVATAALTLDAVFFADGECVGPDQMHLWERIGAECDVFLELARAEDLPRELDRLIGNAEMPVPPPPRGNGRAPVEFFRGTTRHHLGRWLRRMREERGEEFVIATVRSWAETKLPDYRRMS